MLGIPDGQILGNIRNRLEPVSLPGKDLIQQYSRDLSVSVDTMTVLTTDMLPKIRVFNTEHSETTAYVTVSRILPNAKESAVYRGHRTLVRPYLIFCHPDYVVPFRKCLKLLSG